MMLAGCGDDSGSSPESSSDTMGGAGGVLSADAVIPLSEVTEAFPEITQEAESGPDRTAIADPTGTRAVIFTNGDGSLRVTISVGQYASDEDAGAAYDEAVDASEAAPGFQLVTAPDLGEQAFAGTSQVGDEMHFGLGTIDGDLIVAATYAGLPVTDENSDKLIALAASELETAQQAL